MKYINMLIILTLSFNLYDDNDDVVQINGKADFDKFVTENDLFLVEFYAPWCGHCKNLAPHFKEAAKKLKEDNIKVVAIDANADINKDLATEYGIQGFPTLKVYNTIHGKVGNGFSDQEGPRDAEGIMNQLKRERLPVVTEVTSLPSDLPKDIPAILLVGDKYKSEFSSLATSKKEFLKFYQAKSLDNQNENTMTVFHKGEKGNSSSIQSDDDITAFISTNAYPVVGKLGPENYKFYLDRGLDMFWFGLEDDDNLEKNVKIIEEGVSDYPGKYSQVYLDQGKFKQFLEQQMGCNHVKCGILLKNGKNKFILGETFTSEAIKAFLKKDETGDVESFVKSQDIPDEKEENNVVVLVSKNFKHEVENKNVFVFFYAPWCGHCKSAKPEYEKLKDSLNDSDVVIAKFDATENDIEHPKLDVQGFPTFYFFKKGDYNNPLKYEGGRTLNDWKDFVKTNKA